MIRPTKPYCFACGHQRRSTRVVVINGVSCDMCDMCPTPAEIRERAAAVRAGWDDLEHEARRLGISRQHVAYALQLRADEKVCEMVYPPGPANY